MPLAEFLLLNAVLLTLLNIAPGDDARTCSWEVQRECESKQPLKTLLISVPDAAAHHKGLHGRRRRRGVPHRACHRRTCSMPPAPRSPSHRTAPRTGPVSCPRACRPALSYSRVLVHGAGVHDCGHAAASVTAIRSSSLTLRLDLCVPQVSRSTPRPGGSSSLATSKTRAGRSGSRAGAPA